jgi:cell envelope-related function transcriptional attenuator common domain
MAIWKRSLTVFAVLVLGVVALAVGKGVSMLNNIGGGTIKATEWWSLYQNPREFFPGTDRINILVIGKDYNRDSKGMPYTKGARADTILLMSLDLSRRQISALSIPRDTYINAPDGRTGKINGTYSRGGEELLCASIEKLIGVKPDYFVALKPDAVREIVDRLGGVEVETIDAMEYNDWWGKLFVKLPAGRQRINGEQAIGFTRFREADVYRRNPDGSPVLGRNGRPVRKPSREVIHSKEEGDFRRMARQQQLIRAVIAEGKKPQNLMKADQVIDAGLKAVDTSLERKQIFALAALFRDMETDRMQSASLLGEGSTRGGTYYFRPDEDKNKYLVDWLLRGDEMAANRLTVVEVMNGTKVPNMAKTVTSLLRDEGYDARNEGNAPRPEGEQEWSATRVVYRKAAVQARAQRIARLLGTENVVKEAAAGATDAAAAGSDEQGADVTVVLGRDLAAHLTPTQRSARL